MSSLREKYAINQKGIIRDPVQAEVHAKSQPMLIEEIPINRIDLSAQFDKLINAGKNNDLEDIPRETILKMLIQKPELEVEFTFKVMKGEADHYIQAMRQVLTRTRRKAKKEKRRLQDFKLLVKNTETKEDHDVVTLVRAKSIAPHLRSVYNELLDAFEEPRKG